MNTNTTPPNPNAGNETPDDHLVAGLDNPLAIAETALVCGCLHYPEAIGEVAQRLTPRDFPTKKWGILFEAMLTLFEKGEPVDPASLGQWLYRRGATRSLEIRYADILEIWQLRGTAGNLQPHIDVLREHSLRLQLERAGDEIAWKASRPHESIQQALGEAQRGIQEIAERTVEHDLVPISAAIARVYDRIDRARTTRPGILTPWEEVNRLTGGLQPEELIVVAARPSVGKTALATNLAVQVACKLKRGVFFASLEQSDEELTQRMLCQLARLDAHKVRNGLLSRYEEKLLAEAGHELNEAPLWIDQKASQGVLRISANARRLGSKIGLVIVDYLQLIEPENRREQRHEQVSQVSKRLKQLARECQVPVVALAQLNRSAEEGPRRRPRLSDLRESGGIEAAADTVWLMHRPDDERRSSPQPIEINIAKQRNGPTGELVLHYYPSWLLFQSITEMDALREANKKGRRDDDD